MALHVQLEFSSLCWRWKLPVGTGALPGAQGHLTDQPYLLLERALVQRLLAGHEGCKSPALQ